MCVYSDGVIEASINHTKGWLINSDVEDIYSSEEPQKAFHKRIVFCLELHNDAVKAMRYPPSDDTKSKKSDKDSSNEEKNDEKTIDEIIKELEEEEDDFF